MMVPSSLHWSRTPRWPGTGAHRPSAAALSFAARNFFVLSIALFLVAWLMAFGAWHAWRSDQGLGLLPWLFAAALCAGGGYVSVRVWWILARD